MLASHGECSESLSCTMDGGKVYLLHDSVHLMKNIRNNLLNRRRLIFPPFEFLDFDISFPGGEISWKLLHDLHDKDKSKSSNLKKAPKITSQVCE